MRKPSYDIDDIKESICVKEKHQNTNDMEIEVCDNTIQNNIAEPNETFSNNKKSNHQNNDIKSQNNDMEIENTMNQLSTTNISDGLKQNEMCEESTQHESDNDVVMGITLRKNDNVQIGARTLLHCDDIDEIVTNVMPIAVSLSTPWFAAIMLGIKTIEWRSFPIGSKHLNSKQYVFIHRSSTQSKMPDILVPYSDDINKICTETEKGCIHGMVRFSNIIDASKKQELQEHDPDFGETDTHNYKYGHCIKDVIIFTPGIKQKGNCSNFAVSSDWKSHLKNKNTKVSAVTIKPVNCRLIKHKNITFHGGKTKVAFTIYTKAHK